MSSSSKLTACCVFHEGERKADVICLTHDTLFCYSCLVVKKHNEEGCDVKEIKTLSDLESLKIELTLVNQEANRKDSNLSTHVAKIKQKENELKNEINAFYNSLSERITKLQSDTLGAVGEHAEVILGRANEDIAVINALKNDVTSLLEQLDQLDPQTAKIKVEAIKGELKNIADRSSVDGWFHKDKGLERELFRAPVLGEVILCESDTGYETLDFPSGTELDILENTTTLVNLQKRSPEEKSNDRSSKQKEEVYTSSEICDNTCSKVVQSTNEPLEESASQESAKDVKLFKPQKESKSWWPFWKKKGKEEKEPQTSSPASDKRRSQPSPAKNDSKQTIVSQPVYAETSFARYLVQADTTIQLHPQEGWKKTAHLTKITALKNLNRFVFLDSANGEVILSDSRGKVYERKACKSPIDLLSFDDENVAVLHGSSVQIAVYRLIDQTLKKENNFHIHASENLTPCEITGFSKIPSLMEFAVVAEEKVIITNERGEILRKYEFDESRVSVCDYKTQPHLLTTFDFSKHFLYIVKVTPTRKTLKCYNFKDKKFEWMVACSDAEFEPKAVVQYEDQLLVLSKTTVMAFSAATGESIKPMSPIKCLPADAIGFCVLYDTGNVAVTGQSEDLTASLTVGFVAI